jgi:hypothetical protein
MCVVGVWRQGWWEEGDSSRSASQRASRGVTRGAAAAAARTATGCWLKRSHACCTSTLCFV